jgi:hypothetical protein
MGDQIFTMPQDLETYKKESPFQSGQPVRAESVGAAELYTVNSPGTNPLRQGQGIDNAVSDTQKELRITLDGVSTTYAATDYPPLLNASIATLTPANRLEVVCILRGIGQRFLGILNRVNVLAAPGAGEFSIDGSNDLILGEAQNEGTSVELWMLDAADVTNTTFVAGVPQEVDTEDVMSCDVADVTFTRLVSGGS